MEFRGFQRKTRLGGGSGFRRGKQQNDSKKLSGFLSGVKCLHGVWMKRLLGGKIGGTGFRGRAGIHELMQVSPRLRQRVQAGTRADELRLDALAEGMRTLRQDGITKVLAGITSIEDVHATSNH